MTPYHAKYFAHDLTRRAPGGIDRLSMSLFDAAVDLNPHQIEAVLFALASPLSKGVILADEVGLGKTIEAGIVLCPTLGGAQETAARVVSCFASKAMGLGTTGKVQSASADPGLKKLP